ncbi:LacI family DNA-binding transcriptional regulator [Bacillus sp. B15-48]|uniref:LacI family DNA-binding transcriptional regulator n=1 Tax=Bacillus sp. B15-48 TaxID=1548601 RepID=UPI00193FDD4F|nr:LacI family DNA-binding transcriptional regulator [Bacillus sp. B15-48]MBM4761246.1 substrate-binding domain-containing protein [Bacillus sp. B15-48]
MAVTIKDIAKNANVSIATVSRVINNKADGIREETKQRVLDAIKEHNYQPNTIARSMITKKTSTIGLIIPDIRNPFFPELVRGVEDFSKKSNYTVFLCNTDGDIEREKEYFNLMKEKSVDGVIYTYAHGGFEEILNNNIPIVLLDRGLDENQFSGVCIDNEKAGYMATKHLIELSHERIGCITGPDNIQSSRDRLKGYKRALEEAGLPINQAFIKTGDYQMEGGYEAAKLLLKENSVTAIFAFNDLMAFGVYQAAQEFGLTIPDDLSVVGFDNIKYNRLLQPKLTTIDQPTYRMGELATEILLDQINNDKNNQIKSINLEPHLIIGDSSQVYKK